MDIDVAASSIGLSRWVSWLQEEDEVKVCWDPDERIYVVGFNGNVEYAVTLPTGHFKRCLNGRRLSRSERLRELSVVYGRVRFVI